LARATGIIGRGKTSELCRNKQFGSVSREIKRPRFACCGLYPWQIQVPPILTCRNIPVGTSVSTRLAVQVRHFLYNHCLLKYYVFVVVIFGFPFFYFTLYGPLDLG